MLLDSDLKWGMFQLADPHPFILSMYSELLPALFCSGIVAAILAILLSFPVFRVRGDYLAIVTLGFGFIIKILAINNPEWTNGAIGLNEIPNNHDSIVGAIEKLLLNLSTNDSPLQEFFNFLYIHAFGNGANITVFFGVESLPPLQ